ncbi:hypothetical protein BED47_00875 [Gottfriedia luciferensis]|uniref:Portal protein n=1 Tax=Gottfriedia luciferensis TaxID=178774 RepID=A0ABX2ZWL7_9BACI|nr:hypothetical protein [Gottfriedia luciferensis]ODG93754.1 hypothetical protein BED47_00875 [Gottfriedia luciferensis]
MYINSVISYLGAWDNLNEKHQEEYVDLISTIGSLILGSVQTEEDLNVEYRMMKTQWKKSLDKLNWVNLDDNVLCDYAKNKVKVSLYIGDDPNTVSAWAFTNCNLSIKNDECEIPLLILPINETGQTLFGDNEPLGYRAVTFDRTLAEFTAFSPLSLKYPFIILGISDNESPIEIFNISTDLEGHNTNVVMDRSIEFPPEYYQAGLGILSYFHKVLKAKYPGVQATVRIIQEGLVVRMVVETADGDKHIVEKALEEYDLILQGEIRPEDYFGLSTQAIELKNELRLADARIETQKELLAITQKQIDVKDVQINTLMAIVSNGISNPVSPVINVDVAPVITIDNNLNQQNIIHNELKETIDTIRNLKHTIDSPEAIESLNEVEKALSEADENNINNTAGISKLQKFLEKVNNTESTVSKSITTTNAGVELIKNLASCYNKIAPFCGLPSIPFIK